MSSQQQTDMEIKNFGIRQDTLICVFCEMRVPPPGAVQCIGDSVLCLWRDGIIRCCPPPACVCFNWTACILSCSLRLGLCAGLYWRPSATQQGLLFLHSGHSSRTFSRKRCTVLFWHVQGKNFLPKGQYFCQDMYKEKKKLVGEW